jgi:hypothetical protein
VVDVVAQKPGAFYKLRYQLAFQIERHRRWRFSQSFLIV